MYICVCACVWRGVRGGMDRSGFSRESRGRSNGMRGREGKGGVGGGSQSPFKRVL